MADDSLYVVVEIPKGSSNKYEWDDELGAIKLDRLLFSSLGYPTDYGFFRNTLAADGDPLDAMVVVSEPTFPGCYIEVKPVALFRMRDENAEDNKILCVPLTDPNWSHVESLDDLPMSLKDEISHFFSIYKTPDWKVVKVDGWYPKEEALESIERAFGRFKERSGRVARERGDHPVLQPAGAVRVDAVHEDREGDARCRRSSGSSRPAPRRPCSVPVLAWQRSRAAVRRMRSTACRCARRPRARSRTRGAGRPPRPCGRAACTTWRGVVRLARERPEPSTTRGRRPKPAIVRAHDDAARAGRASGGAELRRPAP